MSERDKHSSLLRFAINSGYKKIEVFEKCFTRVGSQVANSLAYLAALSVMKLRVITLTSGVNVNKLFPITDKHAK
jgi:hypothetical protein